MDRSDVLAKMQLYFNLPTPTSKWSAIWNQIDQKENKREITSPRLVLVIKYHK